MLHKHVPNMCNKQKTYQMFQLFYNVICPFVSESICSNRWFKLLAMCVNHLEFCPCCIEKNWLPCKQPNNLRRLSCYKCIVCKLLWDSLKNAQFSKCCTEASKHMEMHNSNILHWFYIDITKKEKLVFLNVH